MIFLSTVHKPIRHYHVRESCHIFKQNSPSSILDSHPMTYHDFVPNDCLLVLKYKIVNMIIGPQSHHRPINGLEHC
jgi:hypothetical protein